MMKTVMSLVACLSFAVSAGAAEPVPEAGETVAYRADFHLLFKTNERVNKPAGVGKTPEECREILRSLLLADEFFIAAMNQGISVGLSCTPVRQKSKEQKKEAETASE